MRLEPQVHRTGCEASGVDSYHECLRGIHNVNGKIEVVSRRIQCQGCASAGSRRGVRTADGLAGSSSRGIDIQASGRDRARAICAHLACNRLRERRGKAIGLHRIATLDGRQ